jgi:N-carbamoylputrescine amidase
VIGVLVVIAIVIIIAVVAAARASRPKPSDENEQREQAVAAGLKPGLRDVEQRRPGFSPAESPEPAPDTQPNGAPASAGASQPQQPPAEAGAPLEAVTVSEIAGVEFAIPAETEPETPQVIEVAGVEMPAPQRDVEVAQAATSNQRPATQNPQPATHNPPPSQPAEAGAPPHAIIREPRSEKKHMSRIVKAGLIQTALACSTDESLDTIREAQTERTVKYIEQAAEQGVQLICMQEIFTGPYFCAEQSTRWYDSVEKIPEGPTTQLMMKLAAKHKMVIVVPLYEEESTGVYYNTAAVIDADGTYLGKYRKNHIPHVAPGFWEKFYFRPGNLGYPVFQTKYAKVGVYICYDRHFPEGARELGLAGAEIVFNPSATVAGLSEYLWKLEQPAHAVANGYFVGAINRVGMEAPWNIGEFYGQSYFCDPRGQIIAIADRDKDALVVADLDLDMIREVRNTWQFYRDRRPETYNGIVRL